MTRGGFFYYYCFFSFPPLSRCTAQMFASFSISLPFIDIISDARRRIVWAIKLAKSFITPNSFRVVQYNAGGWKCAAMGHVLLTVGWATAVGRGSVSGRTSHKLSVSALFIFFSFEVLCKAGLQALATAPLQCWGTLAAALEGPKLKSEPKSSVTEEGNPKPNPWLPAAATHISSGSNDSWYLKKKYKK